MPIKGAKEFKRFKEGKPLTRKQAILAQCYECNGYEAEDCLGTSCALYEYHPWRKVSILSPQIKKIINPETLKKMQQGRIRTNQERKALIVTNSFAEDLR